KLYKKPRGTLENAPENVRAFQGIVSEFFDFAVTHEPSLHRYFEQKNTTLHAERDNNRNLFFRPVGLEVLARLYAHFVGKDKLATLVYGLQSLQFENPGGVFDGVLWNAGKIEASAKAKTAGVELCLYLLDQLTPSREAKLTETLREVRRNPGYLLPPKSAAPP